MFVTKKKFNKVIGVFLDAIEWLENKFDNKIKLMELNQEAKLYELEFTKTFDMYDVIKDGEFFTAFNSLKELITWFAWYKEWINDITVTICDDDFDCPCDDCIDNGCVDTVQYIPWPVWPKWDKWDTVFVDSIKEEVLSSNETNND